MSRHVLAIMTCALIALALLFAASVDVTGWHTALIGWATSTGILALSVVAALFMAGPRP